MERRLLERFDAAAGSKSKGAHDVMHECVRTLQALSESHTVVMRWIATRPLFLDVSGFTVRPTARSAMPLSAGTIRLARKRYSVGGDGGLFVTHADYAASL